MTRPHSSFFITTTETARINNCSLATNICLGVIISLKGTDIGGLGEVRETFGL